MLKMRPLTDEEATALKKIAHRSRDGVQRTRAKVIRAMARTGKVALAAKAGGVSPQYAREIIHRFEQDGLESLPAKHEGGRQHILDEQTIEAIRGLAGQNPKMLGTPWTCWSVAKLLTTAINKGIVPKVSQETFRQALHRGGVTYQETKTWKQSSDPEFHEKLTRVKALYDKCPIGSVVVCVDEFGPLECRPYNGRTWAECKKPVRLPATYRRTQGVQHFLAMYDVHHNFLWGWFYKRKRGEEFIEFLKRVRGAYASWVRIYVVMDNFSPHIRQDVKKYAAKSRMELVYIATNASWMNRIEAHFRPLRKFALEGSYPKTHEELEKQIMDYLEWRNANPNDPEILEEQKKCRVA